MSTENDTGLVAARVWTLMADLVLSNVRRREASEQLGLSFAKLRVLRRITSPSIPMGELAARADVDPPYLTLIVDDLERRGLVVREEHPTDRRAKVVSLTTEGRDVATIAESILNRPPSPLLELPSEDLATMERILLSTRQSAQQ
jgi:DNA-binding MarR family transcriptional regulator